MWNEKNVCLQIIRDEAKVEGRPGEFLDSLDLEALKKELIEEHGVDVTDEDVMSAAMYPQVGVVNI